MAKFYRDGLLRVCDGLTLGRVAHLALATFYECHDGGSGALALAVGNNYDQVQKEISRVPYVE